MRPRGFHSVIADTAGINTKAAVPYICPRHLPMDALYRTTGYNSIVDNAYTA